MISATGRLFPHLRSHVFCGTLGVRITSDGEYLDIEAILPDQAEASIKALNDTMSGRCGSHRVCKVTDNAKQQCPWLRLADCGFL